MENSNMISQNKSLVQSLKYSENEDLQINHVKIQNNEYFLSIPVLSLQQDLNLYSFSIFACLNPRQ